MTQISDKNKQKLQRLAKTLDNGNVGLLQVINEVEDNLNAKVEDVKTIVTESIDEIKKNLSQKLDEELVYEVDEEKIVDSVLSKIDIPKDGEDGQDGKDYILTEQDKREIAGKIKVPVVEKITTETIREIPIVTENVVEKAVADSGEVIVEKINYLPINNEYLKIDAKHIKNLPKSETRVIGGGISRMLADSLYQPLGSGGINTEDLSSQVDGTNFTFIATHIPRIIMADGGVYIENFGYTLSGLTITMSFVPQNFVVSLY